MLIRPDPSVGSDVHIPVLVIAQFQHPDKRRDQVTVGT